MFLRENKEHKALKENKDQLVSKDLLVLQELLDLLDLKDLRDLRERMVTMVLEAHRDLRVIKVDINL